jgi:hypothetical protein
MKSVIAIYEDHEKAVASVSALQATGYDVKQVSLLGKADMVNNHITVSSSDSAQSTELSIGIVAGTILGTLSGISILAIPGLGFIFGAGALVGAFAGFDLGIIGGGLVAIFTAVGMNQLMSSRYEKYLNDGKFLVVVQGEDDQLEKAYQILHTTGLHIALDRN